MNQPGQDAAHYVEVHDEPDHRHCMNNRHAWVYRVQLVPGQTTLWHRHVEDTVYLSLAAAQAQESFAAKPDIVTDIPCGIAVLRPHRNEPLIHQVTNVSDDAFHLLGVEILAPLDAGQQAVEPACKTELMLDLPCARVWRCDSEAGLCLRGGVVVATAATTCDGERPARLERGDVRWADAESGLVFTDAFAGFFVGWR